MTDTKSPLPEQQAKLLAYIDAYIREGMSFPTIPEMRAYMGWKNERSVDDCLDRLAYRGLLRRVGRARVWLRLV